MSRSKSGREVKCADVARAAKEYIGSIDNARQQLQLEFRDRNPNLCMHYTGMLWWKTYTVPKTAKEISRSEMNHADSSAWFRACNLAYQSYELAEKLLHLAESVSGTDAQMFITIDDAEEIGLK